MGAGPQPTSTLTRPWPSLVIRLHDEEVDKAWKGFDEAGGSIPEFSFFKGYGHLQYPGAVGKESMQRLKGM